MMAQDCLLPKSDYLCRAVKGGGSYPINRTQSPDWVDKKPRATHSSCHSTLILCSGLYKHAVQETKLILFHTLALHSSVLYRFC